MRFAGEPVETDLEDQVCTQLVCDKVHLSSLFKRDERDVVMELDYKTDPFSGLRETECASCRTYLLSFLLRAMEKTKWVPKTKRVICTNCSRGDIKLAYGKCSHKSFCSRCLQKVSVSLAETCTYLAVVYREDVHEDDLEPPITLKSDDMALINWMQRLFSETMNLWVSKPLQSVQVSNTHPCIQYNISQDDS